MQFICTPVPGESLFNPAGPIQDPLHARATSRFEFALDGIAAEILDDHN